jgi:limonene-1,2-epoxide hydrolase
MNTSFDLRKDVRRLLILPIIALGLGVVFTSLDSDSWAQSNEDGSNTMGKDIQVIHDFVTAFNARDVDKIMEFFMEDAIYHNMPSGPVQGTDAIRSLIASFVNPASSMDWEVLQIAQTGDTVLTERIDRFVIGGKNVELPVMGAFDMKDGKIAAWRDYFDMATWQKQMAN